MFVSILQLMGFPVLKPVNSRAIEEMAHDKPSRARVEGISSQASDPVANTKQTFASESLAQKKTARRQEVKAQPVKATVAPKPTHVVTQAKPAKTAVLKPGDEPKAKPVAKSAAVAATQPPPEKASSAKVPVKAAAGGKAPKPPPKLMPPADKVAPVDEAKVKVKDSVKTTTSKAAQPEVVVSKPKVARTVAPGTMAQAAMAAKPVAAPPISAATASVPPRAGRPSSRLAQLTVPSMAQSVASTAAKASFMQTTSAPLIVPPLASAIKKDPKLANNWKLKPLAELTDADLMAMPDDEYMNDTQMAYFRRKLSLLKDDILSNAGETTEHLREDTVVVPDPADRATIEEEHALELRTRDRERKLLKKIEQSIQRIDAGDYGYCDETGEAIGVGRLLARPTANLSLEAQQRRELKQKMFGD